MRKRAKAKKDDRMRLQKYISQCGITSRRNAEIMIQEGKVQINGVTVREMGIKIDPKNDTVKVNGNEICLPETLVYLALYKPRWMITTMNDPQNRPSVYELLKQLPLRVYPAGRLDFESEGLLLMTNDGEMANKIMHPRYHLPKVYRVEWEGSPTQKQIENFKSPMILDTKKVQVKKLTLIKEFAKSSIYEIVLTEGLYRQIRRMSEKVGLKVLQLKRIAIGDIRLDNLAPGQYRYLSKKEVENLYLDPRKKLI